MSLHDLEDNEVERKVTGEIARLQKILPQVQREMTLVARREVRFPSRLSKSTLRVCACACRCVCLTRSTCVLRRR